jgi:uncharacterized protein involved in response to NO
MIAVPSVPSSRWRFAWLYAAPHRLAFAAAATMLGVSALWWALALVAQQQGHALHFGLPPYEAHSLLMALGFMPLFFAGFLFTAGPKWLGHGPVEARTLQGPLLAQLCGWSVFGLGVHGVDAAMGEVFGGLGLAAVTFGWTRLWWRFVGLWRSSRATDKVHAGVVAAAGGIGALAMALAAIGLATGQHGLVRAATLAALWLFIGPVYAAVAHRMIPFFTASALPILDAWRPRWLLWSLLVALGVEGVFAIAESLAGPLPAPLCAAQAAFELPVGLALMLLALRWGLVQSLRIRLLAMLHLGFVWLGLAFVLSAFSHGLSAATAGALTLGLGPLHAYTMGFLGSTLIAMATRVSAGHGGRTLAADDFVWRLFGVLQLAVVARVVAGMLAAMGQSAAMPLIALAALAWAVACALWALRYGHWYGTPRADGRPG